MFLSMFKLNLCLLYFWYDETSVEKCNMDQIDRQCTPVISGIF